MKVKSDYVKALLKTDKVGYKELSIFGLQKEMIEKGICPRCGAYSRCWSSSTGKFPCWECGFNITPNEINKLFDEDKPAKYILKRRLKQRRVVR